MLKLFKYGVALCVLSMSGTMINTQAFCRCDDESNMESFDSYFTSDKRNPQTIIYDIVSEFLGDETITKAKKVLVLGYDGFREDALANVLEMPQSGIKSLMEEGGLYHSYAGSNGNQETSTAPGWLSILSGEWAYTLGVLDNDDEKSVLGETLLHEADTLGYSSAFVSSWATHFDTTYRKDILSFENKTEYKQLANDEETVAFLQEELANTSQTSFDVMCGILEYTDHSGHDKGYGNHVDEYKVASQEVDQIGYELLQTIYNRESYDKEEWLIVITTDHGGIETMHGGQSDAERNTWFAVNKLSSLIE